jgi:hypothetical protein
VLTALLRVADALDRSHNQPIASVSVALDTQDGGLPPQARVVAHTVDEAYLERWAAERRIDLVGQVLGAAVTIDLVTDGRPVGFHSDTTDQVE